MPSYPAPEDAPASAVPPPRRARGSVLRYVLPVALFVLVIAGIAWAVQYVPSWRAAHRPDPAAGPRYALPVKFPRNVAAWDKADPMYVRSFERGEKGHYDFPFENLTDAELEIGLIQGSCDCSSVLAAALSADQYTTLTTSLDADPGQPPVYGSEPTWLTLEPEAKNGAPLHIPAGGRGVVRVTWKNRKEPGASLNLTPRLWTRSAADSVRWEVRLAVPTVSAFPFFALADRTDVGVLPPGGSERFALDLWSTTRDVLDLTFDAAKDPHLVVERWDKLDGDALMALRKRLVNHELKEIEAKVNEAKTVEERAELAAKLETQRKAMIANARRVRSGYRAIVRLYEMRDGKQMEQGPFKIAVPLLLDGRPVDLIDCPHVKGRVRSDVEVGAAEDRGAIDLGSFSASAGKRQSVSLWAPDKLKLAVKAQAPAYVEARLTHAAGGTTGRAHWRLEVVIPPETLPGSLPEDSSIVLRVEGGSTPRILRIPLYGRATAN